MLITENEDSSVCEEPKIYYYSTNTNNGVKAYFSERKIKALNKYTMPLSPTSSPNNLFSLCNTIMKPSIILDYEKNNNYSNNKLSNSNFQAKPSIQIENTRIKTDSSKEERIIFDKNQLKENNQKDIILEKNPFFLGKNLKLNFCKEDINYKNNEEMENSCQNENNGNDIKDFYRKENLSKSYVCSKSKSTSKIQEKEDDEFKSEKKLIKKSKKLSLGKDTLDLKKGKITKNKSHKKKWRNSLNTKNIKIYNDNKKDEDSLKLKNIKKKFDKEKNNEKKNKILFYSNKCNNKNVNNLNIKKNKLGNNSKEIRTKGKNNSVRGIKTYKYNIFNSQRIDSKFNKQKINEEENAKVNKKRISNKFKSYQPKEGIKILKEYLKYKEKNHESSEENSSIKEKRKEIFKKRYNSKNEKEFKQIFKKKNITEEDNFKKSIFYNEVKVKEKESTFMNINKKINKCLTIDINKQKRDTIINKDFKQKSTSITLKKKNKDVELINFFGKTNNKFKKLDFENVIKKNIKKTQFNLFSQDKFTNTEFNKCDYLKYTLDCMDLILDIDLEKQNRIKNKVNFTFPKQKKNKIKKKIALFDLDETLIHCTGDIRTKKEEKYQHIVEIKLPGNQTVEVGINIRPYWKQTLNLIKKKYYIVVYTASHQAYADAVLDFMDPQKKYFKYRLYRNNCSLVDVEGQKFYVKDLDIFNEFYDLKDIIIIDNSVLSFAFHLHNGIPIVPYYDEDKDGSLYVVGLYLMHIFKEDDLREANKKQINLDSFLEEAKKNREEFIEEEEIIEESNSEDEKNNSFNDKEITKPEKKITKRSIKKFDKEKILKKKTLTDYTKDTQKKLMSQSKLINMYYEVKDSSINNNDINEENNFNKEKEDDEKKIFFFNNEDYKCKSVPGLFNNDQNNYSYNEYTDEERQNIIPKKKFSIMEDISLKQNKEKNENLFYKSEKNNNLKFIRSNFYNRFKI